MLPTGSFIVARAQPRKHIKENPVRLSSPYICKNVELIHQCSELVNAVSFYKSNVKENPASKHGYFSAVRVLRGLSWSISKLSFKENVSKSRKEYGWWKEEGEEGGRSSFVSQSPPLLFSKQPPLPPPLPLINVITWPLTEVLLSTPQKVAAAAARQLSAGITFSICKSVFVLYVF